MSLTMFSVGRDTQLVLIGPTGRIDLTHVTSFDSRSDNPLGEGGPAGWHAHGHRVAERLGRELRA